MKQERNIKKKITKTKGFTLVELMIVIAIIAILASIAIPQYLKYQRKAKVSSYALPIARACIMDIASYCVDNPNQNVNINTIPNCQSPINTAGGEVSLTIDNSITCAADGSITTTGNFISATLSGVTDYKAYCGYENNTIKCTVK